LPLLRVVLTTGLACRGSAHLHEILVGITEGVDRVIGVRADVQVADRVEQLCHLLVALGNRRAELGAVDVQVVEQPLEVVLTGRAKSRRLDVGEDLRQCLVRVRVVAGSLADVGEQVARQDVEALLLNRGGPAKLGVTVRQRGVVEIRLARCIFLLVQIGRQVLADTPVEEHPRT